MQGQIPITRCVTGVYFVWLSDASIFHVGQTIKIGDLQLLKCCGESGKETLQTVKIIEEVCHKWREIACLLSSDVNHAAKLSQRFPNDPSQCLRQLFVDCFINNRCASGRYSQDWIGIFELLGDIDMEILAAKVQEIVSNKYGETVLHSQSQKK